jgi:hypothetical protein
VVGSNAKDGVSDRVSSSLFGCPLECWPTQGLLPSAIVSCLRLRVFLR